MSTVTIPPPIHREPELLGQTVVVVGGSAGIGFETARRAVLTFVSSSSAIFNASAFDKGKESSPSRRSSSARRPVAGQSVTGA